jgi:hypothetical protein
MPIEKQYSELKEIIREELITTHRDRLKELIEEEFIDEGTNNDQQLKELIVEMMNSKKKV